MVSKYNNKTSFLAEWNKGDTLEPVSISKPTAEDVVFKYRVVMPS